MSLSLRGGGPGALYECAHPLRILLSWLIRHLDARGDVHPVRLNDFHGFGHVFRIEPPRQEDWRPVCQSALLTRVDDPIPAEGFARTAGLLGIVGVQNDGCRAGLLGPLTGLSDEGCVCYADDLHRVQPSTCKSFQYTAIHLAIQLNVRYSELVQEFCDLRRNHAVCDFDECNRSCGRGQVTKDVTSHWNVELSRTGDEVEADKVRAGLSSG